MPWKVKNPTHPVEEAVFKKLPFIRGKRLLYRNLFLFPLFMTLAGAVVIYLTGWSWWYVPFLAWLSFTWAGGIIRYEKIVNNPMFYAWLIKQEILGED